MRRGEASGAWPLVSPKFSLPDASPLPVGWRWVKLGDVCEINPRRPSLFREDTVPTTFVPMSAVDDISGAIVSPEKKPYTDVKRGYTYFTENDVIFAKITPCMENGKQAIARNLVDRIGFGSTEFHVIRPNEQILAEWIWYFVRQPAIRQTAANYFTGAVGQQRVPDSFLKSLEIPIPPLDEQRRIAAWLNEQMAAVQQARQAAESQLQAARALPSAYLREVFESGNAKKWQRRKLADLCEITARQVDPKIPDYGALPHVNGENIESGTCQLLYLNSASEEGMTSQKYLFDSGDILYSKLRPYLRKVVLAGFKGVCSADMYPIKTNSQELAPEFLLWVLVSDEFTKYADEESRRSRMPKLNREQLFAWEAPLPPLSEQKYFADFLKDKIGQTKQLQKSLESQLAAIHQLPAALLRQAFTGEI